MEQMHLNGVWAPALTPFYEDGSVNTSEYERLVRFLLGQGLNGVFVGGTTGEFVNLTVEERQTLLAAARSGARDAGGVLFNVTAMNLRDVQRLMDFGRTHGADAFSVTAPYYHRYDAAALTEYFCTLAMLAEGMPFYLYNMSGMTNNPVTTSILREVSRRCPNVRGIKDSSMDFLTLQEYRAALPDLEIVTGNDAQLYYALCAGAQGGIIAVSSAFPKLCAGIFEAYQAGDFMLARSRQEKVMQVRRLFRSVMPVMAHKYALQLQGFSMGPGRFPFRSLTETEKKVLCDGLQKLALL